MKTRNIDLVAYLQTKSILPKKQKYISPVESEYTFEDTKQLQEYSRKFYSGTAQVNLVQYLYHRGVVKQTNRKEGIRKGKIKSAKVDFVGDESTNVLPNQNFWYIDKECKIQNASFDPENLYHLELKERNNIFKTSHDAVKARQQLI